MLHRQLIVVRVRLPPSHERTIISHAISRAMDTYKSSIVSNKKISKQRILSPFIFLILGTILFVLVLLNGIMRMFYILFVHEL